MFWTLVEAPDSILYRHQWWQWWGGQWQGWCRSLPLLGTRLLLWAGRGRTGLNVIYSGTGEVVTVTPSQVRSETSSETLKLNIQLKLTSTPPPASTLLLVTDPEYHIIDLRRCSAPCRWVQDTRICLSSAICAVWTLQRINTAAADQIDEEIIYCGDPPF